MGNVPVRSVIYAEEGVIEKYFCEESIGLIKDDGKRLLDPLEGIRLIEETNRIIHEFCNACRRLRQEPSRFREFEEICLELFAYFLTSTEFVTHHVDQRLKDIVSDEEILVLSTPTGPDLIFNEMKDFVSVAKDPTDHNISQHALDYPFLFCNIDSDEDVLELLKERIEEADVDGLLSNIQSMIDQKDNIKNRQYEIFQKKDDPELVYLSFLLKTLAVLRFDMKACWSGIHYILFDLFREVAEKNGSSINDVMMFFTMEEMRGVLEGTGKVLQEEIDERRKAYLYHYEGGKIDFFAGEAAQKKKEELLKTEEKKETTICGQTANPGKAIGKVLLLKTDDLREISRIAKVADKENILVAGGTNPNMMVIINKISGIVTDEGGIICHAAIVSRELGIPCIVGTGNATKILQDGEMIEMDTDRGIVKRKNIK